MDAFKVREMMASANNSRFRTNLSVSGAGK